MSMTKSKLEQQQWRTGYGINMLPLATFALETYGDDPCECFAAKGGEDSGNSQQMLERRIYSQEGNYKIEE